MQGCDTWQTCSMWLGAGIALLRLEQLKESEDALMEANVRNNKGEMSKFSTIHESPRLPPAPPPPPPPPPPPARALLLLRTCRPDPTTATLPALTSHSKTPKLADPVVWGFVALVCLARGDKVRVDQADRAIVQAHRLGLDGSALLRELANSYTALDLLESAEALFRRSLSCESSAHTRRRLADVLSAQNSLAAAVNEYKAVIEANEDPSEMALAAGECEKLLVALGRSEEVPQIQALAAAIKAC